MKAALKQHIEEQLNGIIKNYTPLSGGDTAQVYQLTTTTGTFVSKINDHPTALASFQAEAKGLKTIAESHTITTPTVIACSAIHSAAFLLLEYIPAQRGSQQNFKQLGEQLAALHQTTSSTFGNHSDNFIGQLHQSNKNHNNWIDFYTKERLIPQLNLAHQNGLLKIHDLPYQTVILERLTDLCPTIKPSLLHGDLWSGNFLFHTNGSPYLIDPACYYGHSEIDIAMSLLFGGFDTAFYDAYFSIMSRESYFKERVELYQLYYLLVHLNLFGKSYYGSVKRILDKYFCYTNP